MYDEAESILYCQNTYAADIALEHPKLIIFRPELMIDVLPNAVEYYARACPSLKTFKLHIGIMPTIRRWGLFGGPHDCDKLKKIAASAVKLCDKVVF